MPTEECYEECEILTSIYSEINIEHDKPNEGESLISMVLYPSTGDDETSRHVTITLEFVLPENYPDVLPVISFRNPRGLSEIKLEDLQVTVVKKSEELIGNSMMFQIRDIVQEFLTGNNRPASECPICLLSFTDFDVFFRTECFHHYHSKCLGTYLQNVITTFKAAGEQKLPNDKLVLCCPVCRMDLDPNTDVEKLLSAPPPAEETLDSLEETTLPEDWLGKRETLKALYLKQKQQGGIIDLTEKNKKLLVISDSINSTASSGTTTTTVTTTATGDHREPSVRTIPSVQESVTRNSKSTTGTTTSSTTTTAHSQRNQPKLPSGPPAHRDREDGQQAQGQGRERDRDHGHSHGHGHHPRHRHAHYRGESRTYHNNYNNHPSTELKTVKNTTTTTSATTNPPKEVTLTSESQSQVKVTGHGHGHGHGQGHNRDRRRPK